MENSSFARLDLHVSHQPFNVYLPAVAALSPAKDTRLRSLVGIPASITVHDSETHTFHICYDITACLK